MSVPIETRSIQYAGNAAATVFAVPFTFAADDDIDVTLLLDGETVPTAQTQGTHYTLTGASNSNDGEGGELTMLAAPANLSTLTISRTVPITQATNLRTSGPFSPAVHMAIADKLCHVDQQLAARIAALEALGTLLDISTFDATVVTVDIEVDADAVEDTFTGGLVTVAVPADFTVTGVVVVKTAGKAGSVTPYVSGGQEAVQVRDWAQAGTTLTLGFVTGLEIALDYTLTLLLVSLVP